MTEKRKIPSEIIRLEREFEVIIEQDEDGIYVASLPELEGCHTQAETLDKLRDRISEAAVLCLGNMPGRLKCWIVSGNKLTVRDFHK